MILAVLSGAARHQVDIVDDIMMMSS